MPVNPSDALLTTVARQFATNAAPLDAEFVGHGMPAAFLADLQASIGAFEEALRGRGMSRDERVAARTSIKTALSNARAAVRKLDVIVANHPALTDAVREVWKRDRRIEYAVRSRKAAGPPSDAETVLEPAAPKPIGEGGSAVAPRVLRSPASEGGSAKAEGEAPLPAVAGV